MKHEMFEDDLEDLVSAEDFLDYFEVPYEQSVVHVNRLHILQRFHNYLTAATMPEEEEGRYAVYLNSLARAYEDFVNSDAKTEAVLKVYQRQNGTSFFNVDQLRGGTA